MTNSIPKDISSIIHSRIVEAAKTNSNYAQSLHAAGESYNTCDAADVHVKLWLLTMMKQGATPEEAVGEFIGFLMDMVIPSFLNIPHVKSERTGEGDLAMFAADSLEDLEAQFKEFLHSEIDQAEKEAKHHTKQ